MEDKSTFGGFFQRGAVVKEVAGHAVRPEPTNWDLNDPKVQERLSSCFLLASKMLKGL